MDPECQFPEYLEELPEPEVFAGLDDRARNSPEKFTGDSLRRLLALSIARISYGDAQQIVKRIEAADGGTVEAALEADGITAEAAGLARACPDWLRLVIAPLLEEIASGPDSECLGSVAAAGWRGGNYPACKSRRGPSDPAQKAKSGAGSRGLALSVLGLRASPHIRGSQAYSMFMMQEE